MKDAPINYVGRKLPLGQSVAPALGEVLRSNPRIDQATKDNFARSLSDEDAVTRVDIFGSYPNYSPLAFDSVLGPAAQQWSSTAGPGRAAFWRLRRSRPLQASLPMADAERRAMSAGWLLGQITGEIHIPPSPYSEPVRIYDGEQHEWVAFPHPLLTPPSQFTASYDWLPAVLESILLAIAQSHEPPVMRSLRPYRLLRELFDANSQDAASGIVELSAARRLAEFLHDGSAAGRPISRIPEIAAAQSAAGRADAVLGWLSAVGNLAAQYLPAGSAGAADDGRYTTIATRAKAGKTPIFRDLAPDVSWAVSVLTRLVSEAHERIEHLPAQATMGVEQPEMQGVSLLSEHGSEEVAIPQGGMF